ncbi:MAG: hypothetical protein SFT92_01595 [Rickettsiales bacterium]|nr:hypothetical protein [Rickettsiales bacterium]
MLKKPSKKQDIASYATTTARRGSLLALTSCLSLFPHKNLVSDASTEATIDSNDLIPTDINWQQHSDANASIERIIHEFFTMEGIKNTIWPDAYARRPWKKSESDNSDEPGTYQCRCALIKPSEAYCFYDTWYPDGRPECFRGGGDSYDDGMPTGDILYGWYNDNSWQTGGSGPCLLWNPGFNDPRHGRIMMDDKVLYNWKGTQMLGNGIVCDPGSDPDDMHKPKEQRRFREISQCDLGWWYANWRYNRQKEFEQGGTDHRQVYFAGGSNIYMGGLLGGTVTLWCLPVEQDDVPNAYVGDDDSKYGDNAPTLKDDTGRSYSLKGKYSNRHFYQAWSGLDWTSADAGGATSGTGYGSGDPNSPEDTCERGLQLRFRKPFLRVPGLDCLCMPPGGEIGCALPSPDPPCPAKRLEEDWIYGPTGKDNRYRDMCVGGAPLTPSNFDTKTGQFKYVNPATGDTISDETYQPGGDVKFCNPGDMAGTEHCKPPAANDEFVSYAEAMSVFHQMVSGTVSGSKPLFGTCMPMKDTSAITFSSGVTTAIGSAGYSQPAETQSKRSSYFKLYPNTAFTTYLNLDNRPFGKTGAETGRYDAYKASNYYKNWTFFMQGREAPLVPPGNNDTNIIMFPGGEITQSHNGKTLLVDTSAGDAFVILPSINNFAPPFSVTIQKTTTVADEGETPPKVYISTNQYQTAGIATVSKHDPVVVSAPGHGLRNGQRIYINGVVGMPEINNRYYTVDKVTPNTFELLSVFGSGYSGNGAGGVILYNYESVDGAVTKTLSSMAADVFEIRSVTVREGDPITINSPGHGLINGERIYISGVLGMTQLNDKYYNVTGATKDSFKLQGETGAGYAAYIGGGKIKTTYKRGESVTLIPIREYQSRDQIPSAPLRTNRWISDEMNCPDVFQRNPKITELPTPAPPPGLTVSDMKREDLPEMAEMNRYKADKCYNYYILSRAEMPWYSMERPNVGTDDPLSLIDPERAILDSCQPMVNGNAAYKVMRAQFSNDPYEKKLPSIIEKNSGFAPVPAYNKRADRNLAEYYLSEYVQKAWDRDYNPVYKYNPLTGKDEVVIEPQISTVQPVNPITNHIDPVTGKKLLGYTLPKDKRIPKDFGTFDLPCIMPQKIWINSGDRPTMPPNINGEADDGFTCPNPAPSSKCLTFYDIDKDYEDFTHHSNNPPGGYCPNVEKINDPTHPFSPRYDIVTYFRRATITDPETGEKKPGDIYPQTDFGAIRDGQVMHGTPTIPPNLIGTDRAYSWIASSTMEDKCTKQKFFMYSDFNAKPINPDGSPAGEPYRSEADKNNNPVVQCALVPVDVLTFRFEAFNNCIRQRINYNFNDYLKKGHYRTNNLQKTDHGGRIPKRGYNPPCKTRFWETDSVNDCPVRMSIQQCCRIITKPVVPANFLKIRNCENFERNRLDDNWRKWTAKWQAAVKSPPGQYVTPPDPWYGSLTWLSAENFAPSQHGGVRLDPLNSPITTEMVEEQPNAFKGSHNTFVNNAEQVQIAYMAKRREMMLGCGLPGQQQREPKEFRFDNYFRAFELQYDTAAYPEDPWKAEFDPLARFTDSDQTAYPYDPLIKEYAPTLEAFKNILMPYLLNGTNTDGNFESNPPRKYLGVHKPYMFWWDTGSSVGENQGGDFVNTTGSFDVVIGVGREENLGSTSLFPYGYGGMTYNGQIAGLEWWGGYNASSVNFANERVQSWPMTPRYKATRYSERVYQNHAAEIGRVGGWSELKAHQMWTTRRNNLVCIGRYEKLFKPGSADNFVLAKAGAGYTSKDNVQWPWPLGWRGYVSAPWPHAQFPYLRNFPMLHIDEKPATDANNAIVAANYNPMDGQRILGPTGERGLDNVLPGDIVYNLPSINGIAYVTDIGGYAYYDDNGKEQMLPANEKALFSYKKGKFYWKATYDKSSGCTNFSNAIPLHPTQIYVVQWDNGKFPTITGSTVNWGMGAERTIYKNEVPRTYRDDICNRDVRALTLPPATNVGKLGPLCTGSGSDADPNCTPRDADAKPKDCRLGNDPYLTGAACKQLNCQPDCIDSDYSACKLGIAYAAVSSIQSANVAWYYGLCMCGSVDGSHNQWCENGNWPEHNYATCRICSDDQGNRIDKGVCNGTMSPPAANGGEPVTTYNFSRNAPDYNDDGWLTASVYRPSRDVIKCMTLVNDHKAKLEDGPFSGFITSAQRTALVTTPWHQLKSTKINLPSPYDMDKTYAWTPTTGKLFKNNETSDSYRNSIVFQGVTSLVNSSIWSYCVNGGFDPPPHWAKEYKGAQTGALTDTTLCGPGWYGCSTVNPSRTKFFPALRYTQVPGMNWPDQSNWKVEDGGWQRVMHADGYSMSWDQCNYPDSIDANVCKFLGPSGASIGSWYDFYSGNQGLCPNTGIPDWWDDGRPIDSGGQAAQDRAWCKQPVCEALRMPCRHKSQ